MWNKYLTNKISILCIVKWVKDLIVNMFTECPEIGDPVDGGELKLTTVSADATRFHFSCAWQLKLPENDDYSSDLSIFVRLTNINIDEYGKLSR